MNHENEKSIIYGYKRVNGKVETVEEQAELVRQTYIKMNEYTKHPPKELVESKIEEVYEVSGERLSYEDAEKQISYASIMSYVEKELGFKKKFEYEKGITYSGMVYQSGDMLKKLKEKYPTEEIIDREIFEEAQEAIQKM